MDVNSAKEKLKSKRKAIEELTNELKELETQVFNSSFATINDILEDGVVVKVANGASGCVIRSFASDLYVSIPGHRAVPIRDYTENLVNKKNPLYTIIEVTSKTGVKLKVPFPELRSKMCSVNSYLDSVKERLNDTSEYLSRCLSSLKYLNTRVSSLVSDVERMDTLGYEELQVHEKEMETQLATLEELSLAMERVASRVSALKRDVNRSTFNILESASKEVK